MNVLVVAAHPDDEVLGCGAVMARLSREGHNVSVLVLGTGLTARQADGAEVDESAMETLHAQCRKAGSVLGANDVVIDDLPDNKFDTVAMLDIVKRVEAAIAEKQPEVIYTHSGGDLNIDHACAFRAVMTAARPGLSTVKKVYSFEVLSSTDWSFQQFAPAFSPNTFVDVSTTIDTKVEAMKAYESEIREFPHPRSEEAIRAAAIRWGSVAGCAAVEAFELVREMV